MSEGTELTLAELHEMTSEELTKAATEEGLIPSGKYLTKVRSFIAKRNAETAERDPGRTVIQFAVTLYDADGFTKVGDLWLYVSPDARYTKAGKLDSQANRYRELQKALGVREDNPGVIAEAAMQQGFMTKVRETYIVEEADLHATHSDKNPSATGEVWVSLGADDAVLREYYIGLGYEPRTMIDRIYRVR